MNEFVSGCQSVWRQSSPSFRISRFFECVGGGGGIKKDESSLPFVVKNDSIK